MRLGSYKRTGYSWKELSLFKQSLLDAAAFFVALGSHSNIWHGCVSLEDCAGELLWQDLTVCSSPGWAGPPSPAAWTWLLPTPKDTLSLSLCLADPKLQLCSGSAQFPLVLCTYLFFSQAFSEEFLEKMGQYSPRYCSLTQIHWQMNFFCCLAASPALCPRPSPVRTSCNTLKPTTAFR